MVDPFGVRMIYPTNTSSERPEPWSLGIEDWEERTPEWDTNEQTNINGIDNQNNTNGFIQLKIDSDGQIRYGVQAVPGETSITETDQSILRTRGYTDSEKDWKNVEMTLYAQVNEASGTRNGGQHFELMARGGEHSDDIECQVTALHANLYRDGDVKFEKELSHTDGYTDGAEDPRVNGATNDHMDTWVDYKRIFYNMKDGNVKLELWLDENATNNWGTEPILEYIDNGTWPIEDLAQNECEGDTYEKLTGGGPLATFRWDNLQDVDKYASVRGIIPPA